MRPQDFLRLLFHPFFAQTSAKATNALILACIDHRLIPTKILGECGYVDRNIANIVQGASIEASIEFAVKVNKLKNIVVLGHYDCGGVKKFLAQAQAQAQASAPASALKQWVDGLQPVYDLHQEELESIQDFAQRAKRLVSYNVLHQMCNASKSVTVRAAWQDGQAVRICGAVYDTHKKRIVPHSAMSLESVEDAEKLEHALDLCANPPASAVPQAKL